MKTLRQANVGDTVKVTKLHGEGAVKRRIMDMGLTKGVDVYIRKVAPLGDPVEVTVRGYEPVSYTHLVKAIMRSFNHECGVINLDDGVEFWFELDSAG